MGRKMNLRVSKETDSGLNVEFVNQNSGRKIPLEHAVQQIAKDNPAYDGYGAVVKQDGTTYIRSLPDKSTRNNIEPK